jgi:hypothetical protein
MALVTWTTLTSELLKASRLTAILTAFKTQLNGLLDRLNIKTRYVISPVTMSAPIVTSENKVHACLVIPPGAYMDNTKTGADAAHMNIRWLGVFVRRIATDIRVTLSVCALGTGSPDKVLFEKVYSANATECPTSPDVDATIPFIPASVAASVAFFNPATQYLHLEAYHQDGGNFDSGDAVTVTVHLFSELVDSGEL